MKISVFNDGISTQPARADYFSWLRELIGQLAECKFHRVNRASKWTPKTRRREASTLNLDSFLEILEYCGAMLSAACNQTRYL